MFADAAAGSEGSAAAAGADLLSEGRRHTGAWQTRQVALHLLSQRVHHQEERRDAHPRGAHERATLLVRLLPQEDGEEDDQDAPRESLLLQVTFTS